ncbi:neuroblastoma breakpoint family member 12-like isoform X1 [Pan paniscus]|uniref:neuroblastoma breakpoint family member 12-like isoform X1 n=1 Tax=Pan paniscus TaxID=9597 RepID=UPI0030041716
MNILEINEKLRPQLAKKKQQFRSLQEKCFVTELAGFLANGQKKYKYEECEDLIKSMLRNERRQFKEEKLAEQLKQAEELRQYKVLVHSQERELTQLREKLREGRDAARSLNEHLQALLTPDEPDKSQGQDLQEQLAEGCRLAQQLVQKLSPENDEDEDEDVQVEEAEKVQKSSPPREVQKAEESKVPEDSLEECAITCSNSHGPCDSNQPHKNIKITFEEYEVNSPLVVDRESSHGECQDALNILPEYEECEDLIKSMLRNERRQFKEEKLAEQLKQAEELRQYKVLVHSQERELTQLREKLREGRDAARSLNEHLQALLTPDEPDKSQGQDLQEQLAEGCRLAQQLVQKLSPENDEDEDEDVQVEEAEKVQKSSPPREVQKAEESKVPEDSLEECAITCSNSHGPCDSNQPHKNIKITFEEYEVNSPLVVDRESSHGECQDALNILPEYEECEDLIKSMLRNERRQFKEEKLAEQLKQAEELRQYKVLAHSQERELTQLKEKLWEGRDAARSLNEHVQALLTPDEPDKSQGQDLQEQLAEGCRLAQQLVQKLSPENDEDEDEDVQVEEAEKVQKSSPPREVQKAEESKVPEDSLEECAITCSNSHGPCDSNQPHKNIKITFEEYEVNSPLVVDRESSHGECQDALNILPEYEECEDLIKSMLRNERRQFKEEKLAEQLKQAEELRQYKVLAHSQERELTQLKEKLWEGRDAARSLNEHVQALLTPDEPDKSQGQDLQEQLAEGCRLAQQLVQKLSPENDEDEDEDVQVEEAEKVQKSSPPREVQKAEESKVPEDSLEECAITCSNSHGPCDSNQPHKNIKITFEEYEVNSPLVVDRESSHGECQDALNILPEYEECEDLIKSMLRNERRQFKEEKLAEQLKQAEELRQYKVLAHSQERELTQLKEKLWEGRDAARSLNEHVQALLTPDEPDKSQGQDLQEQLAEGCRLAQQLVQKLSPENDEDEDEDVQVEEAEKVQKSSPPREMQKAEGKEVPEDSLEECAITCSNSHGHYDSNQPHRKTKFTFEEDKVDSTLIGSSSHVEWEDAVHIIPENESDNEEEEEKGPVSPRLSRELLEVVEPEVLQDSLDRCYSTPSSCLEQPDSCQAYGSSFYALEEKRVGFSLDVGEIEKKGKGKKRRGRRSKKKRRRGRKEGEEDQNPPCPRLNGMLMEVEEPEVLQDSLDRCYSTPSMYFELPDSFQHYRSVFYSFEEQHISFALYVDNRLNGVLMEVEEPEVLQDSLDRCYSTPSGCLELTDSCQPYRSAFYVLEQQRVGLAVDMDGIEKYQEVEEDQDPSCPRLSRELLDDKGPEVLQDSLDRCYSTPSGYLELPDLGQPYSSAVYSLEEQYLGLALDVDRIKKNQEEEEDQGPPCPRLSRELLEVVEPEVLQDSLDRCYSTPSSCLEQPDSCQAYGSSFYALEEKRVGFSLDVGEIEKKGKGKKRRGRRSKKKRRRGRKEGEEDQNPPCPRLNGMLMEVEEPEVLQDSLDRCYSTPSMYFELPDSFQHYRSVFYSFEEQHISFALYVDNRLNGVLMEVEEPEVLQDSLDRCYSTPSGCLELTDSCQPYRSAFYVLEQQRVGLAVDMDGIEKYQEVEEDQDPSCPRLSRELLDDKGPEVLQDSLDRCYSTPSGYLELPDLGQPYSSAVYSLEEQYLGLALDVDRIKKNQEEEEDQGPPCPRLSRELLEVVEPEVLQDSLDRCYSTPSSCLEQPDSCQAYGSSFYALEEKRVGFSLDVGEIEKKGKGKKRRGRRSKKKRRRGRKEGEEDQNPPCPRLNGMLMEVEEPEVLQDSLDRCYSTPSMYFELPDSFQHYRSVFYSFEEQHISFALYVDNRLNGVLMEVEEPEVLQDSLDRCYSTPSGCLELTDSCQPYRSAFYVLEQQRVGLAVDMDGIEKYQEVEEDQDPSCPRLSRELLDDKGPEVLQDSLDRCYSTPSGYLELPDLGQPYSSAVYSLEEQYLGLALDVDRIKKNQEEEEDQGPPCPRLSRELLEVVEPEVLQDSLDRCYSTPSSCLEQPDSCQAYGSSFYALEEKRVGFSLDVGEIEKKGKGKKRRGRRSKKKRRRGRKEGEEDQNPPCPRLNGMLMEVEEPEVLQDSLDRCYSTPSMYFELPDSFQHYRSVFYSFEEQHISFALYVDNRFFTLTVTSLHLVFQMEVIFPQ